MINRQASRSITFLLLCATLCTAVRAAEPEAGPPHAGETAEQRAERLEWWKSARFGMFVHWGVYSVVGGQYRGQELPNSAEWMMCRGKIPIAEYKGYADRFNPTKFDAQAFVKLAKDAGMKYLVITAKHHDGFSMFASESNSFNVVEATPFKRDIMKELADACQEQGIRFGFYYSQAQDWNHPGGFGNGWDKTLKRVSNDEYVRDKAAPEVKQLLTKYGPIGIFWWDTPRKMSRESFDSLHSLTSLQPNVITNDRLGEDYPGDYKTFERKIPRQAPAAEDWEVCMPISGSWGYKLSDKSFKSTTTLIQNLADIASKGGNYLLNVSPTGEGVLLPQATERLEAIGRWMETNSESIYGTSASPLPKLDWGRCTTKKSDAGTKLYLHVFDWPEGGQLLVPGLKNSVVAASLLDGGSPVDAVLGEDGVTIDLPSQAPDQANSVVVLEVSGPLEVEQESTSVGEGGALVLTADTAFTHNNEGSQEIRLQNHDDIPNLAYWTDQEAWVEWSFSVDRPGVYQVWAELAVEESKTRFDIGLPGQLQTVEVASTGGYREYATKHLGEVQLLESGNHMLRIKPVSGSWEPVNLRKIELKPAASGGR